MCMCFFPLTLQNPSSLSSTCPLSFLSRSVETVPGPSSALSVAMGASSGRGDGGGCAEFVAVVVVVGVGVGVDAVVVSGRVAAPRGASVVSAPSPPALSA